MKKHDALTERLLKAFQSGPLPARECTNLPSLQNAVRKYEIFDDLYIETEIEYIPEQDISILRGKYSVTVINGKATINDYYVETDARPNVRLMVHFTNDDDGLPLRGKAIRVRLTTEGGNGGPEMGAWYLWNVGMLEDHRYTGEYDSHTLFGGVMGPDYDESNEWMDTIFIESDIAMIRYCELERFV